MVRCRVLVQADNHRIPITPDDDCWSVDGRVYVKFQELNDETLIGTVDGDIVLSGRKEMSILYVPNAYEFIVDVDTTNQNCLLCKGQGFVNGVSCGQCEAFEE